MVGAGSVLLLALAGCGSSSGNDSSLTPTAASSTAATSSNASPSLDSTSATGGTGTSPVLLSDAVSEQLDLAIGKAMQDADVPGALVGIWSPQGQFVRAFGVADKQTGEKMTTDLFMRIGSETKTFTVTAVLQLVDDGKLSLADPIGKYLDGIPNGGDQATIKELANMTSGLPSYTGNKEFVDEFLADPHRQWTPEELLQYAYQLPQVFPPGEKTQYSDTNTIMLGLVVEKVSGMALQEFLQERIFTPVGLPSTTFPTDASFSSPHAHGYTEQTPTGAEADATDWNPSDAWSAGAMISTVDDLGVWAKTLVTGDLLKPQTQADRLDVPLNDGIGYGIGIFESHGWLGHNGSIPGYQSVTVYLPEADTALVVLLTSDNSVLVDDGKATSEPSTLFAKAITSIISPDHVFDLPPMPVSAPSSSAAPTTTG